VKPFGSSRSTSEISVPGFQMKKESNLSNNAPSDRKIVSRCPKDSAGFSPEKIDSKRIEALAREGSRSQEPEYLPFKER
jgi:hypothetical protein